MRMYNNMTAFVQIDIYPKIYQMLK